MPKITYIEHNGKQHVVDAALGQSVMQTAVDNLIPGIVGDCGGSCSCATCHCYVAPDWAARLSPMKEDEELILDGALNVRPTSRLSCQILMSAELDGLVLEMPASQFS